MQNTAPTIVNLASMSKAATITFTALLITFGLFVAMDVLTSSDNITITEPPAYVVIDPIFNAPDEVLIEQPTKLPPIEVKKIPETLPKVIEENPSDNKPSWGDLYEVQAPVVKNTIGTQLGNPDGDVRPIVRVEPKYPIDAARNGIEGWAKLSFSINPLGQVIDVQVVDSEPKRLFDREASRAIKKWKYHPQIVEGEAITKNNMMVVLEFKLANDS